MSDIQQEIDAMRDATDEGIAESALEAPRARITRLPRRYGVYQYSKMFGDGEQFVIREDTYEEFIAAKRNIDKLFAKIEVKRSTPIPTKPTEPDPTLQRTCWSCGAIAEERRGISKKNGKPYRALFCSTGNTSHTRFL